MSAAFRLPLRALILGLQQVRGSLGLNLGSSICLKSLAVSCSILGILIIIVFQALFDPVHDTQPWMHSRGEAVVHGQGVESLGGVLALPTGGTWMVLG